MSTVESKTIIGALGNSLDLKVGDTVLLQYNGYREVPKFLCSTKATIVKFNRIKVVVNPEMCYDDAISVRQDQIRMKIGGSSD